jgi:hypothetical protein
LIREPVVRGLLEAKNKECRLIHEERFEGKEYREAIEKFRVEQDKKRVRKSKIRYTWFSSSF